MPSPTILEFTLNDPSSLNAFSLSEAERLAKSLKTKFDALLFTAEGSHFCSGGNLSDYAGMKAATTGKAVNRKIAEVLNKVQALGVPTACVVQGDCLGGGIEVISSFDYVISVPEAQFGFWQRRIGLSFGWGGRTRLERRLSAAKIDQLALNARNLSSYESLDFGLIDQIAISSQVKDQAIAWLVKTASLPILPLQELKISRDKTTFSETKMFEKLWLNEEHRKVLSKFKK